MSSFHQAARASGFALVLLALVGMGACNAGDAARVATAMTAHILCSQTFIAGREPRDVFESFVKRAPGLDRVGPFLSYDIDTTRKRVRVALGGGFQEEAAFADGRGCTVGAAQQPLNLLQTGGVSDPLHAPDAIVSTDNPAIAAALDRAFAEPKSGPAQNVAAIVVVRKGRIIAERYAPGVTPDMPQHGWSASKSVVQALFGVLERQGRVDVHQPARVAAWAQPGDPRRLVTVDMLLRQVAGQPFGSQNSGFDPASQMLFLARDTYAASAAPPFDPRGAPWRYSDANYQILSGILRDELGAPSDVVAFAQSELFEPIGMRHVTMEFDAAGALMGSAFLFASARDWARFGWLYANDGIVGERRILPEGWVAYSRRPTPQSPWGYGAGFWTNVGDSEGARRRRDWGAPEGSFYANGNFGQTIVIVPKERLVVARFGFSLENGGVSLERTMRLVGEIASATRN